MPKVLNKRTDKIPSDAIYIGRPSVYGNPFPITSTRSRTQSVELFKKYFDKNDNLKKLVKSELKGKDLVCWCAPLLCHGHILREYANRKIFVFGSNLAGRHGKGAALYARCYRGAIYGQGVGPQGGSYAIPTKDGHLNVLPLWVISTYIHQFIDYAKHHPELNFEITRIGCGLAGYKPSQIAPLFENGTTLSNLYFNWDGKTYGEPNIN